MSAERDDCMMVIMPELYNEDRGYQLATIWPGVRGIFPIENYYCGHDLYLAIGHANSLNRSYGHEPGLVTSVFELVSGLNNFTFHPA
ncbi:MAG: hypothetical protein CSYNP_03532 [Syntrophus sp. SKADARSKE-3]|nr:hypothetical protein [Syntrophus sp. SKADARSKE-3]